MDSVSDKFPFPKIPEEIGEDGGKVYQHYDDLAEELDQDLVNSIKAQLDGILIFSGLFAGVNSAFLALTLPQMSANPVDDTNALLSQLIKGHNNSTQQIEDLPSASFSPPRSMPSINGLFSMSLTLALLSSFLAVLGQQWLVQYRKRTGAGAEHQRWEQLRRHLGAKRWRFEFILGHALPSLLQISLIIFCTAFVLFLRTLNSSISWAVTALMILVAAIVLIFTIAAAWDQWCPYKSPLSQLLQMALPSSFRFLGCVGAAGIRLGLPTWKRAQRFIHTVMPPFIGPTYRVRRRDLSMEEAVKLSRKRSAAILNWFRTHSSRPADGIEELKVIAVKRLLCTSEDPEALVQAAINLQAYKDREGLRSLLQDGDFHARLRDLFHTSYWENNGHWDWNVGAGVFGTTFLYVILSEGSIDDFCPKEGSVALTRTPYQEMSLQLAAEGKRLIYLGSLFQHGAHPSCQQCDELALWARLIGILLVPSKRDELPFAHYSAFRKDVFRDSVKFRCLVAWAIMVSKEWAGLHEQDQESQDTWCFEKARIAVELYRQAESVARVCQLISDAIATSDSDWEGRPPIEEYIRLLWSSKIQFSEDPQSCGTILRSWGTLLMSVEKTVRKMVRDPGVSFYRRPPEPKDQREECFQQYCSILSNFELGEPKVLDVLRPALTSLFDFLHWLKGVFEEDPTNPENPLVLKLLQGILDEMPSGEQPAWITLETWQGFAQIRSEIASSLAILESIIKVDESPRADEVS